MTPALITAIPVLLGLLASLLQLWNAAAPARRKKADYVAVQQGRQDIIADDTDRIASRIDGLLSSADNDGAVTGEPSAEAAERRISQL